MKNSKNIVVVLPTYNEKDNILSMLDLILKQQSSISRGTLKVLVVDDSSPDGTGEMVKKYSGKNKNVYLLTGRKNGLGAAYIRGFRYAIDKLKADIVFEMDADFSHNPHLIPQFAKKIFAGTDVVIGSRYVPGGTIPLKWSLLRKANSKWGNIFARYIGGMQIVNDCTSGFRAINIAVLKGINLENLNTKGYSFQVSLLYALINENAKIYESPIQFIDRMHGKSKIRLSDITEFILFTFKLRAQINKTKTLKSIRLYIKSLKNISRLAYEKTYNR